MPTPAELLNEIENGPLAATLAPLVSAGNDAGVLVVLSDRTLGETRLTPVRLSAFTQFLMSRSLLRAIRDAEANANLPAAVRDVCYGLLLLLGGGASAEREIDPNDAATIGMVDALVAASVATAEDKTAFLAFCTVACSRLEKLGWSVSLSDVSEALRGVR